MKKVSLLALALSLTSSLAVAQKPTSPCPPEPCPCPQAFQGFYAGGSFGYGTAGLTRKSLINTPAQPLNAAEKYKLTAQGFDGGLLIGYTYVFSNKVGLGLDSYFNWTNTQGHYSIQDVDGSTSYTLSLRNAFQLRVPLSYVISNLVAPKIYIGWENSGWVVSPSYARSNKSRYNGFLWGAGVDFLLAKHIISGIEYTGVISQNKTFSPAPGISISTRPLYNTFKATLKFIY